MGGKFMPKGYHDFELSDKSVIRAIVDIGKRKNISLRIAEDGSPEIRIPLGCSLEQAKQVLEKNIAWIKNTQAKMLDRTGLPKTYSDGEKIMLLGEPLTIRYISGNEFFKPFIEDRELRVSVSSFTTPESVRKQIDAFIADLAFTEIQSCMKKAVELTGLSPDKVTVKPMTSSWGRCISNRHISINSKVVVFDRDCITYVCIHELCHLKEMNHSPQFWALVEKSCPDYKAIKQRMK